MYTIYLSTAKPTKIDTNEMINDLTYTNGLKTEN